MLNRCIGAVVGMVAVPLCLGTAATHLDRALFVPFDSDELTGDCEEPRPHLHADAGQQRLLVEFGHVPALPLLF